MFFSFFYLNSQFLVIPQQKRAKMAWRWQSYQLDYGWTLVPGEALKVPLPEGVQVAPELTSAEVWTV